MITYPLKANVVSVWCHCPAHTKKLPFSFHSVLSRSNLWAAELKAFGIQTLNLQEFRTEENRLTPVTRSVVVM